MADFDKILKAGGSAFPAEWSIPSGGIAKSIGLTMRDYFAGQFLAGMAMSVSRSEVLYTDRMAKDAYAVADAMLAERAK